MSLNYLTTDYSDRTNVVGKVATVLETQRQALIDVRNAGHVTGEITESIRYIEQTLLNLDHYLQRREKHGVYNLDVPENTMKFEERLRGCYNNRATDTTIRLVVDTPSDVYNTEFKLDLAEMATVNELHYYVYRQLLGLKHTHGVLNVIPYLVEHVVDTNQTTLVYFLNIGDRSDINSVVQFFNEVKDEITNNATQYYRKAVAHQNEVTEGKILFLLRDYNDSPNNESNYIELYVELGDVAKGVANNDQEAIQKYTNIMLGIERLFKENDVVVFGLSRLPGVMVSFSEVDLSLFDKVDEVIKHYTK